MPEPTRNVRAICEAVSSLAVSKCLQEGIALEDFYRVLVEEQDKSQGAIGVVQLFRNTLARVRLMRN